MSGGKTPSVLVLVYQLFCSCKWESENANCWWWLLKISRELTAWAALEITWRVWRCACETTACARSALSCTENPCKTYYYFNPQLEQNTSLLPASPLPPPAKRSGRSLFKWPLRLGWIISHHECRRRFFSTARLCGGNYCRYVESLLYMVRHLIDRFSIRILLHWPILAWFLFLRRIGGLRKVWYLFLGLLSKITYTIHYR